MNPLVVALVVAGVAGFVFFFVRWIQLLTGYRSMSEIERRYAEISAVADERRSGEEQTLAQKRAALLHRWGLSDSVFPFVAAFGFFYVMAGAISIGLGASPVLAALIPVPLGLVVAGLGGRIAASKRRERFNKQMVDLLDLLSGQLRSGVGMDRALVNVLPTLQDPMREEIQRAVNIAGSGGDLLEALEDTQRRYPSRSMELFLSLLAIDRSEGTSITGALEQASDIMKKAFELQSEGKAELSSAKTEFYGVLGIVVLITGNSVINSIAPDGSNPWANPLGVIVLAILGANVVFGVFRFTRIVGSLKKETE